MALDKSEVDSDDFENEHTSLPSRSRTHSTMRMEVEVNAPEIPGMTSKKVKLNLSLLLPKSKNTKIYDVCKLFRKMRQLASASAAF